MAQAWARQVKVRLPLRLFLALRWFVRRVDPRRHAGDMDTKLAHAQRAVDLAPLDLTVQQGPFTGMRYVEEPTWGTIGPYLVGSYEEELHPHLERLLAKNPSLVVVLGAADGYYAVGSAMRLPAARVLAVDTDGRATLRCRELAKRNGVSERVETKRHATCGLLQNWLRPSTLVISDCEGAELELLDPERVPALREADVLVELHASVDATLPGTILHRFTPTHAISVVDSVTKSPDQTRYIALTKLPQHLWVEALDEHRYPHPQTMQWAVLEAR